MNAYDSRLMSQYHWFLLWKYVISEHDLNTFIEDTYLYLIPVIL